MLNNNQNRTSWTFPTWETEQEMKRLAEIQARAFQEAAQKAAQQELQRARRMREAQAIQDIRPRGLNPIAQRVQDAVKAAPDYEKKRQQQNAKAQEWKAKGGALAAFGAALEAICK